MSDVIDCYDENNLSRVLDKNNCVEVPVFMTDDDVNPMVIGGMVNRCPQIECKECELQNFTFAQHLYVKNGPSTRTPIIVLAFLGSFGKSKNTSCLVRSYDDTGNKITKLWVLRNYLENNRLCFILKRKKR